MTLGDTFVWCPPGTRLNHLWIVISDPKTHEDGKCVIVNLTESCHGKHSLKLVPGQHRWIYKDSDVNFGDAFATTAAHLKAQANMGGAIVHDPMELAIIQRIVEVARTHPAFPPYLIKLLPPAKQSPGTPKT